ncbi:MAG: hypothetical protein IT209_00545 [Armatimonadetes bacterium]|nr:hypothetical protein [Armatimonadota bacterium]
METTQGANIRAERVRYRLTQQELASELGLLRSTVVEVEQSKLEISQPEYVRWLTGINRLAAHKAEPRTPAECGAGN